MIGIIARHESAALLRSKQTWIIAALMAALFGFQFLKHLESFLGIQAQLASQDHPIGLTGFLSVRYLEPLSLVFTLLAPLFAMRCFSDEFRQQTYALWQSSPVSILSLTLGKFLGVFFVVFLLAILATGLIMPLAALTSLDWPLMASALLGLSLCSAACTACGLYFSSLTKHALVALVSSLACLAISWMLSSAGQGILPLEGLSGLSIATHLRGFFQGFIQTGSVAFFTLTTVLFLCLTLIRLDSLRQSGS